MQTASVTGYTGGQYSLFRLLFGLYLAVHFGHLSFYAAEVFSASGMLPEAHTSPLFAFAPSLLHLGDAPWFVVALTLTGVAAAVAFAAGRFDKLAAAWMMLLLVSLFARNPLIANPALPYVGLMLLAHLFVPPAPYGSLAARGRPDPAAGWIMPRHVFGALTIVLCLSYSYSGYTKLLSPAWVSGETVALVLNNPLARDWFVRDAALWLPDAVPQLVTWFILYVELLFAPLFVLPIPRLRLWLWTGMLVVHLGFLLLLSFADLTIPMLLFHLLVFDPAWLPARSFGRRATLHYDGECGVCHAAVRFALGEVPTTAGTLSFRPMQCDFADVKHIASWRLEDGSRGCFEKTDAVVRLLQASGGVWRVAATALRAVPRPMRDAVYDVMARVRRKIAARPAGLCPVVTPELAKRFSLACPSPSERAES